MYIASPLREHTCPVISVTCHPAEVTFPPLHQADRSIGGVAWQVVAVLENDVCLSTRCKKVKKLDYRA